MLCFSHVSKRFGVLQALADCSFSIARGRMLGFLGPNGTGKTIAGLDPVAVRTLAVAS